MCSRPTLDLAKFAPFVRGDFFDAKLYFEKDKLNIYKLMERGLQTASRSGICLDIGSRLSQREQKIFSILLASARSNSDGSTGNTIIRIAGGWVRDKLLGLDSDDIDVALDDVSGHCFAQTVNAHMKANGYSVKSIGVIQANPGQSKHLETATVMVMDAWLDFVNLRSEVYASDSRIPTIEYGTPEEDALRRDLTINSMFYNVNSNRVEDFTGYGLHDLANRIIRTPIHPDITFLDDPLRVLRAVRFASRFKFDLSPELLAAGCSAKIHTALTNKISRERFGLEFEGMLTGKSARPGLAITLLQQLNLLSVIFTAPILNDVEVYPSRPEGGFDFDTGACMARWMSWLLCREIKQSDLKDSKIGKSNSVGSSSVQCNDQSKSIADKLNQSDIIDLKEDQSRYSVRSEVYQAFSHELQECHIHFLSAILAPLRNFSVSVKKGNLKTIPLSSFIIKECLKLKTKDIQDVAVVLAELNGFKRLSDFVGNSALDRTEVGAAVGNAGPLWKVCLNVACAMELSVLGDLINNFECDESILAIEQKYQKLHQEIISLNLHEAWKIKPLIDGKDMIKKLGCSKGPVIGELMRAQTIWQYANPQGTAEDCIAYLRTNLEIIVQKTSK